MTERRTATADGNEAVASVAHRLSDVIAIDPITPLSAMGELSDEYAVYRQLAGITVPQPEAPIDDHKSPAAPERGD